jgi:hypothetical protein
MSSACGESLLACWSQVSDPRGRKGRRHSLAAMLTAVATGLLCGNRGYKAIAEWLHDLPVDVWHWMGYTRTPPKRDCFRDLLMTLDPADLEAVLSDWIHEVLGLELTDEDLAAVSIDGKQVRPPTDQGGGRSDAVGRGRAHCGLMREPCTCSRLSITRLAACSASVVLMRRPTSTRPPWNCSRRWC